MASKKQISAPKSDARARVSQSDVPAFPIEKALSVARAIGDNYAYKPASPLDVASALGVVPTTGSFRMLTGASLAYGLTTAGWNAGEISITPLGLRIVRPLTDEGDVDRAKREAILIPKIAGEFLRKYDNAALPKNEIAQNVLMTMGVPSERTVEALATIIENAKSVGFLRQINDKTFVDLKGTSITRDTADSAGAITSERQLEPIAAGSLEITMPSPSVAADASRLKKVFITHGKNRALIDPIQKLAAFGDLQAVVSVNSQTASLSVPAKIMEEMRSCGAGIILVENEQTTIDSDGNTQSVLNDNVLIEIGAAMALFGQRFILVVREGVKLPSNLQGLLLLRYKGDTLDVNDTVSLLGAMADMKSRPLP